MQDEKLVITFKTGGLQELTSDEKDFFGVNLELFASFDIMFGTIIIMSVSCVLLSMWF